MTPRSVTPVDVLRSHLGARADGMSEVALMGGADAKKNVLVRYRDGDELRVLKVYRSNWRYYLQVALNPITRKWSRVYKLRGVNVDRALAEQQSARAFQRVGLPTFEIIEQASPDALVFRYYSGRPLTAELRERRDRSYTRDVLHRCTHEFTERQRLAAESGDRYLVHPDPKLKHRWCEDDGTWRHFDFETRVNPALSLEEALAREVESYIYGLRRLDLVGPEELRLVRETLGDDVLDRWNEQRRAPHWHRSYTNRRRAAAAARVLA